MRKFAHPILLFSIPLILALYPLDLAVSYSLKNTTGAIGEFEVWNDVYKGAIKCDLAIYGSSRAWEHIDPDIIEDSLGLSSYNFGIDGYNFELQYFRHNEFIKKNSKPRTILHSVDIFSLGNRADLYNMNQFLPYMLWNKNIYNCISHYEGFSSIDFFIPLVRYLKKASGFDIVARNNLISKPLRNKGFYGQQLEWNSDLSAAQKENEYYVAKIDTTLVRLYKQFLNECKSNSIEVILVYTPEYFEGQNYVSNREEIINIYKEIAKEFHLVFLNYSDHEICFNKQYFYNSEHLNAVGADLFSRILSHDIKNLKTHNIECVE